MRVPVIMQISHFFVFMKGILRRGPNLFFKYLFFEFGMTLNVTKSMYIFPEKMCLRTLWNHGPPEPRIHGTTDISPLILRLKPENMRFLQNKWHSHLFSYTLMT